MTYLIKYRKRGSLFWKKEHIAYHYTDYILETVYEGRAEAKIILQQIAKPVDAMMFVYEDKTFKRIPNWSKYEMILGKDYLEATEKMEKEKKQ